MSKLRQIQTEMANLDEEIAKLYQKRMRLAQETGARKSFAGGLWEFQQIDRFHFEDEKVVFQGVEGAYSHQALQEFCGAKSRSFPVDTWRDAMEAIAKGDANYAVLPIENSSAGMVSENFDLLAEYDSFIIGEQIIRTNHCLIGTKEAKLSDITDVYSHPQALLQCSKYLLERRRWKKHPTKNTAGSAKKIKEEGDKRQAAIASKVTADIYQLKILEEGIEDNASNSTRFIIVTNQKLVRRHADKISICFELPHKSGSLYRALSFFMYNDLNMNRIESRPIQGRTWEYRFFIDLEGNLADANVRRALIGLEKETEKLKILGNY